MAKLLKLGQQTTAYQRTERQEYGTLRSLVKEYQKSAKVAKAVAKPVTAKNFALGTHILITINDVTGKELPSHPIHINKTLSDEIRSGVTPWAAIADFPVIRHKHSEPDDKGNYAEYPLIVRPEMKVEDIAGFDDVSISIDTEKVEYTREVPSIAGILANMINQPA